jgi:hypothetical protein
VHIHAKTNQRMFVFTATSANLAPAVRFPVLRVARKAAKLSGQQTAWAVRQCGGGAEAAAAARTRACVCVDHILCAARLEILFSYRTKLVFS